MKFSLHLALATLLSATLAHAGSSTPQPSPSASHSYLQAQAEQLGVALTGPARRELLQQLQGSGQIVSRKAHLTLLMAQRLEQQTPEQRRNTLHRVREDTRRAMRERWCEGDAEAAVWLRHYPALRRPTPSCTPPDA